ncbi:monooxygenase [Dictyobacter alpinus]|uniref:Monooxygenase n=1 Tax=Dictyobacter alpinus TaxID=2014873 RepID=A0A402BEU8_9CHLR|nr:LLM class flavin-dependent oxidoreductase [Dictyobacter alpinus]GCE29787.1 monooxygenase [Dictyobacter alpinus]
MRVGMQVGTITTPRHRLTGEALARVAEQAEQAGFSTLAMADHFSLRPESTPFIPREENAPVVTEFFEAWSTLAFLAARTSRIKLTTLVSGITMRYPAVLIKTADTLDALSNGRAYLSLGASPDFGLDEHQRMGLSLPPAGERVARLEEVLLMAMQMWSGQDAPFTGTYYHLSSTVGTPFFVQQPHPPILIAGHGNKMLRLMACYADVVSIGFGRDFDAMRERLTYLREQCEQLQRPYEAIQKTTFFTLPIVRDGRLDPVALDMIRELAEMGFDEIMIRQVSDEATFDLLASEFVPLINGVSVGGR